MPPRTAVPVPPPLPAPAPALDFGRLLTLAPADREKILSSRPDKDRQVLEAGLKAFDALPAEEREKRLRALRLRVLIRVPASNRVERLTAIPESERQFVIERLQAWDQLSPELQREFLENERTVRALTHPEFAIPRGAAPAEFPAAKQAEIEAAIARWRALPLDKRQRINEQFQIIFQSENPAKSLDMTEMERLQMAKTLQAFRLLNATQRDACVSGLRRFTQLSPEERNEFLRNVELWQQMSPQERKLWRELVAKFRPPKPPVPVPPPPFPRMPTTPPSALVATNN